MKKILLILILFFAIRPVYSQGWLPVIPNPASEPYTDFQFFNQQTGYALSIALSLVKTTNAGQKWTYTPVTAWDVQNMHFINMQTGFVCGDQGRIFKTTNAGDNWNVVLLSSLGGYIEDIYFPSNDTGYACTHDGYIYKTIDQGMSWDTIFGNGLLFDQKHIYFINNNTGFISTNYGLLKTTNAGESWFNVTFFYTNDIDFANENTGYVEAHTKIYKTTNAGSNWNVILSSDTITYSGLDAINENIVYVASRHDSVAKTTDGGISWTYQNVGFPKADSEIRGIGFINSQTGFVSGGYSNSYFFYTRTGGSVGINPISNEIPQSIRLHQNYPNPFNPETKISFEIPNKSKVKLTVYNSLGKEVRSLIDENLQAGVYEYNFKAENLPSGVYYYTLSGDNFRETRKMILLK